MKNKKIDFDCEDDYKEENEKNYKLGIHDGLLKAEQNSYEDGFREGTEVK
jgi:hypothetical protein